MKKCYHAGATRLTMRTSSGAGTTGLKWLLGDHLSFTAIVAEGSSGALVSELRYKPWGELRYAYQSIPTGQRYTGQRSEGIGLYFYRSRWYDPYPYIQSPEYGLAHPGATSSMINLKSSSTYDSQYFVDAIRVRTTSGGFGKAKVTMPYYSPEC